ncbi:hypothetical protein MPTK1_8g08870 [Marchantia polymorpha subsp. ruderalis]|uniref:Uncharacterized protein n=1 Tax=Marchantia polymorpha TaxID=3197 RepID=A0A2R6WRQ0_MARPO|nr:hypothetical protein MARPO_0063s0031 [Marchantia polymorpha]BBN19228.1 hypothetical protein Mp_8g08870 [Marchantia polymorpha subsp. ruderalis]|eukprot:PTQ36483.1 hypothetical protein MARPO_0063s0031 [Marchantia polymorpha]
MDYDVSICPKYQEIMLVNTNDSLRGIMKCALQQQLRIGDYPWSSTLAERTLGAVSSFLAVGAHLQVCPPSSVIKSVASQNLHPLSRSFQQREFKARKNGDWKQQREPQSPSGSCKNYDLDHSCQYNAVHGHGLCHDGSQILLQSVFRW